MKTYRVLWEIDISAETPEEAANKARKIQLNPESWATVFNVWCKHSTRPVEVDLKEEQ
jgi:hypothetical protein